jgi:lysophospholipase L1-like esterase
MNKNSCIKLSLLTFLILFLLPFISIARTTIHTIGDSTVANYDPASYPQTGWGQVLNFFFNPDNIAINNKAVGGTSSKSFYDKYWTGVKSNIKAGDFVFIQFGINDAVTTTAIHTDAATTFKDYLTNYINETKSLGAYPVLITPQIWNSLTSGTWGAYPEAIRQLATSLNVPLIDLDISSKALVSLVSSDYASTFIYMGLVAGEYPNFPSGASDATHLQRMGAIEIAKLVVVGLKKVNSDVNVSTILIPNLIPTYKVNFIANNSTYGQITRSEYFPSGITLTAKALPIIGKKFDNWSGDLIDTKSITTFVMGTTEKTIHANFSIDNNYVKPSIMADFETVFPKTFDCSWGRVLTADAITIVNNPSVESVN